MVTCAPATVIGPEQRPPLTETCVPPVIEYWKVRPDMPLADDLQISITWADAACAPTARTPTVAIANRTASRRSPLVFPLILPLPLSCGSKRRTHGGKAGIGRS